MSHILNLSTFADKRGNLTVIEKIVPFNINRIFYIYGVDDSTRGGHRHKKTIQAAICLKGECEIYCYNGKVEQTFKLDVPSKCLLLMPEDWHTMFNFTPDCILMVLASEYFDPEDYIYEKYK